MKYSKRIEETLQDKGIQIRDTIKIKKQRKTYEGILLPNTVMSNPECITIKLDNGYNIGINYEGVEKIEKTREKEERKQETRKTPKQNTSKPPISIISTGGTISSEVEYETGAVQPTLTAEEILAKVPEVANHAYIRNYTQVSKIASEDMNPKTWVKLAETIKKELNEGSRGVVITHGTDTMHYTAAALTFMLPNLTKPVIITGSQRSIDRGSTDAAMNLICSTISAAKSNIGEVGIVMHATMNDDHCFYIRGTKAKKMHTSRRDTFRPINNIPIAKISPEGKITKLSDHREYEDKEVTSKAAFEEKTAILKMYPGADPQIMKHYEEKNYAGYILEGTGLGHVPSNGKKTWIPTIKKAVNKGKVVVGATQCTYGRVNPNVYRNLRRLYHEAGAIPAQDMTPETAYVKLGWLLATEKNTEKVKEKMQQNLSGEVTERSTPNTYLY